MTEEPNERLRQFLNDGIESEECEEELKQIARRVYAKYEVTDLG
ncbi:MAG: hypothetical protein WCF23_09400 [Candidatus Nitrosopolaris sp.]